ncbi:MAG: hypothetical protein M3441_21785, partial [Chloroflexota bacterium]|nr:hypothetical protein [Chloroflexota bacterium]
MSSSEVNVYREIARSIVASELEKIKNINLQRFPGLIRERLHELGQKLQDKGAAVHDRLDLIELKSQVNFVSELINFFLASSPSRSSWWAMALIKECYEKCGIDHTKRHTLIIHSLDSEDYGVTPNILSFLPSDLRSPHSPDQPIDIFIIPPEAKHDIASISLIGHEIGHIYWSIHDRMLSNTLSSHFMSQYGAPNLFTQAEL